MADFEERIVDKFNIPSLFEYQRQVLEYLCSHKSVFVCQRTGRGKSLCYEAYTTALDSSEGIVLVVSPLLSIMEEQTRYLQSMDVSAVMLNKDRQIDMEAKDGKHQYIYGSPEIFLGQDDWRETLKSKEFQQRVKLIVIDEAHLVQQWGESKKDEDPFRFWYGQLGQFRSLLPNKPVLALTATASEELRQKIKQKLNIRNCEEVLDNPDRENIKLFVKKVSAGDHLRHTFHWLVQLLDCESVGRILVFCKTIDDTSRLYKMCRRERRGKVRNFDMYHSQTPQEAKDCIAEDMLQADGNIKVLFCTNAAGMGVNYTNVDLVVNYGPPQDNDTLMQHIGRAGRDGSQSTHLLIYNGRQLRNLSADMLVYTKNVTKCRRECLLSGYSATPTTSHVKHLCCDVCDSACELCECDVVKHPAFEEFDSDDESEEISDFRQVSDAHKASVRVFLTEYRDSLPQGVYDRLHHGVTHSTVEEVVDNLHRINHPADILNHADIFSKEAAVAMFEIISTVLSLSDSVSEDEYEEDDDK